MSIEICAVEFLFVADFIIRDKGEWMLIKYFYWFFLFKQNNGLFKQFCIFFCLTFGLFSLTSETFIFAGDVGKFMQQTVKNKQ